jgi:hypothetical protein
MPGKLRNGDGLSTHRRHRTGDSDRPSHAGAGAPSRPTPSAAPHPQAVFSTPASIASATESDPYIVDGQPNYLYLRVWNRGPVNAQNVFASVYWSPPASLVTPSMWNPLGASYFPTVPSGSNVEVTTIGIPWPADLIPAPGHYCFVAVVGNNYQPAPNPAVLSAFATFNDYVNYIANNNNITWRNFNVGPVNLFPKIGGLHGLPFLIAGAWNGDEIFQLEVVADLPEGSKLALQTAEWVGRALRPAPRNTTAHRDFVTDLANPNRLRIPLPANDTHALGDIRLPGNSAVASHMLVHIPPRRHDRAFDVLIRQLYRGQEIGRVTWRLLPGE